MTENDQPLRDACAEIRRIAQDYIANNPGIAFYPDAERVEGVLDGLARRRLRFGAYFCPCRVLKHDADADAAIVCPCPAGAEELKTQGFCKCHLFATADYAEQGHTP